MHFILPCSLVVEVGGDQQLSLAFPCRVAGINAFVPLDVMPVTDIDFTCPYIFLGLEAGNVFDAHMFPVIGFSAAEPSRPFDYAV